MINRLGEWKKRITIKVKIAGPRDDTVKRRMDIA
jgi:hypothetical protein